MALTGVFMRSALLSWHSLHSRCAWSFLALYSRVSSNEEISEFDFTVTISMLLAFSTLLSRVSSNDEMCTSAWCAADSIACIWRVMDCDWFRDSSQSCVARSPQDARAVHRDRRPCNTAFCARHTLAFVLYSRHDLSNRRRRRIWPECRHFILKMIWNKPTLKHIRIKTQSLRFVQLSTHNLLQRNINLCQTIIFLRPVYLECAHAGPKNS